MRWSNTDADSLRYHKTCRTELYNKSKRLSRKQKGEEFAEKEEQKQKRRRSVRDQEDGEETEKLNYKEKCILWNLKVTLSKNNPERRDYSQPDNQSCKETLKRICDIADKRIAVNHDDKWAIEVKGRVLGINDLVAEEALLHKLCSTKFYDFHKFPELHSGTGSGRKLDVDREDLFHKLCDWLENEMENNIFTLEQIYQHYLSLDVSPDRSVSYCKKYLKKKLLQKYGDYIYFTNQERRTDVLCYKDTTAEIIRQYNKNNNGDDQKKKIIDAAIKLIKNDITVASFDPFHYPSLNDMTNLDRQLNILPDSLKSLLKPLLKTDKRVAAWGQSILKVCRPRSGVMPFTMRFGLQIDHRFGSKWLIDELHSIGFSESYYEVGNYKYCYLRNKLK